MGGSRSIHGRDEKWVHNFGQKTWRKRSLGRCRWEGNIRMEQWDGKEWTGWLCLRIGTSGGLLWTRQLKLGFYKSRGVFDQLYEPQILRKGSSACSCIILLNCHRLEPSCWEPFPILTVIAFFLFLFFFCAPSSHNVGRWIQNQFQISESNWKFLVKSHLWFVLSCVAYTSRKCLRRRKILPIRRVWHRTYLPHTALQDFSLTESLWTLQIINIVWSWKVHRK